MSTNRFSCYAMGNESLLIQCMEIALERGHEVLGVVTANRDVRGWAEGKSLRVIEPGAGLAERLGGAPFDWFFSIANLSIVPDDVLRLPRRGAVNFHDGPLPRYAGLNCPMWALVRRDPSHGVTWHMIEGGVDEGDILAQRVFDIADTDTSLTLNTRCYELGMESFGVLVDQLADGSFSRTRQNLEGRFYFGRHDRPEALGLVRWDRPAAEISALVRALDFGTYRNPIWSAKTTTGGPVLLVGSLTLLDGPATAPAGTILAVSEEGIDVAAADGIVRIGALRCISGHHVPAEDYEPHYGARVGARFSVLDDAARERWTALGTELAQNEAFWRKRLASVETAELPYVNRTASPGATEMLSLESKWPGEAALVAAIGAWIARVTGTTRLHVGYRDDALAESTVGLEELVASTVPVEIDVDLPGAFSALATKTGAELERVHAKKTYARDLVVREPGIAAPAFDLVIDVGSKPAATRPMGGASLVVRRSGDRVKLVFDTARLSLVDAQRIRSQLDAVLTSATAEADMPVARLPLLTAEERRRILHQWNATSEEYERDATLVDLFERQVDATPDSVALSFEGQSLTYREVDRRANRLANHLRALGVGPDVLVGLCVGRSIELVVGALAIEKAGGAYVPLDPSYPADRIAFMVEDSRAPVLITAGSAASILPAGQAKVVRLDADAAAIDASSDQRPLRTSGPSNLAYVIYTSGSTGKPKGVMVEQRNVLNFFAGMDERIARRGDGTDVWLAVTSLSFDISVLELFWTLCRGFQVVLSSDEDRALVSGGSDVSQRPISFSLFYFASDEGENAADKYKLLVEGAKFADANGFEAVWTPERHFHAFGGLYPNPAVASAAIAMVTSRVKIRAGSCVLPIHHPVRVAEDWALVDNLSNGRVGISFAAGWQPNDFLLRPEGFQDPKGIMLRDLEVVRRLWRGEKMEFVGPKGPVTIQTLPRPIQKELPVWLTAAGNPDTFAAAGARGAGLLTHLLGQSIDEVREKVAVYRKAWREAGHPGEGHVTLMLHAFVGDDDAAVKERVREPMKDYLRSSMNLIQQHAWAFPAFKRHAKEGVSFADNFASLSAEDTESLLDHSFERYYETSGLFGTPESAMRMVDACKSVGVDEIACLVDFGIDSATVMAHLPALNELRAGSVVVQKVGAEDWSIAAQIRRHHVTHMQCTPSMARMLVMNDEARASLALVEHLFIGGEALPGTLVKELRSATRATITNMYGPTETTVWSSTHRAEPIEGVVSIGRPIANTQLYVLDGVGEPLPVGVPGELYIGGDGVTRGYFQREELTAERFVPDPFVGGAARMYRTGDRAVYRDDGTLDFLGRNDFQVKIRGYRIELGEIESRTAQHPSVREAVVMAREDVPGDQRLVAYCVLRPGASLTHDDLAAHLRENLPEFMVPAHLVVLDRFPLTPNQKIDRKRLPAPEQSSRVEYIAPTSDIESKVAAIWCRLLGLQRVGTKDNFFQLGGHSLLAVQAHREIRTELQCELTVTDIFRFPTIGALAAFLDGGKTDFTKDADRGAARRDAMSRRRDVRRRTA